MGFAGGEIGRSGPKRPGNKTDSKSKKSFSMTKRIRDVKRLLSKPNLDPALRSAQEKRLAGLHVEAEERKARAKERKLAARYHHVRFFERVKLERRLHRLERVAAVGANPRVLADILQTKQDLEYVLNFPKGEKYVSLLKTSEDPTAQEYLEEERSRLRSLVKQQLAEAALVAEPDEGRGLAAATRASDIAIPITKSGKCTVTASKKSVAVKPVGLEMEEDDFFLDEESDGRGINECDDENLTKAPLDNTMNDDIRYNGSYVETSSGSEEELFGEGQTEFISDGDELPGAESPSTSDDQVERRKGIRDRNTYINQCSSVGKGGGFGNAKHVRGKGARGGRIESSVPSHRTSGVGPRKRSSAKLSPGQTRSGKAPLLRSSADAKPAKSPAKDKTPVRKRVEGGRKRRKKK